MRSSVACFENTKIKTASPSFNIVPISPMHLRGTVPDLIDCVPDEFSFNKMPGVVVAAAIVAATVVAVVSLSRCEKVHNFRSRDLTSHLPSLDAFHL